MEDHFVPIITETDKNKNISKSEQSDSQENNIPKPEKETRAPSYSTSTTSSSGSRLPIRQLLWRRLLIVFIMFIIFLFGLIIRILYDTEVFHIEVTNSTAAFTYGIGHLRQRPSLPVGEL